MGNSLVNKIGTTAQHTKNMTPAQLDQYDADEFMKSQRAYGAALEEEVRSAVVMIHDLAGKPPGLTHLLQSKGLGDSALVVIVRTPTRPIAHAGFTARASAQGRRATPFSYTRRPVEHVAAHAIKADAVRQLGLSRMPVSRIVRPARTECLCDPS